MTEEQILALVSRAASEAAEKAVKDTLLLMGVAIGNDESVLDMQKDFQHLRDSREGKEEFIKKSKATLIGIFVTTVLAVLAKGFWAEITSMVTKLGGS